VIVVDTSALVGVFLREAGSDRIMECLAAQTSLIPVSVFVEFTLLGKLGAARKAWLDELLSDASISVCGIDAGSLDIARAAASKYGKGTGHPAGLNFGDCLVYAVAKYRDLPLLYIGDDFGHTDIASAL